jgi:probable HAF family extracellular repeat protein
MGHAGRRRATGRATGRAGWRARWVATAVAGLLLAGILAGIGVVAPGPVGAEPGRPRAVDLTGVSSTAWDINDRGVVVGWFVPEGTDQAHAFRWSARRGLTDLGPGSAKAINEAGVVVGTRTDADGIGRATRWTAAGVAQDLGVEGWSWANDINDHGTIVGYQSLPDGDIRGFVIEPGAAPELLAHPAELGGLSDVAVAVNERGAIAGYSNDETSGWPLPVLWQGRRHTPAVVPGRRDNYDVTGINERGTIVGSTLDGELGYQAVTWVGRDHREVDVGPSGVHSLGRALNDEGQVVGIRYLAGDAFRWDPRTGRTTILTGLTDVRNEALAVNNQGTVVGYSTLADGTQHATLFAPR